MRRTWFAFFGTTLFSLALLTALALAMGVGLAQEPQGPWPDLEVGVSPTEIPVGDAFVTALVLRNEGTEPATVDEATVVLPGGVIYVGQVVGSDVADSPQAEESRLRWTGPFTVPAGTELQIRFAAVAGSQAAPGQHAIRATALSGEQSLTAESAIGLLPQETRELPAVEPVEVEGAAVAPGAVQVNKTAEPDSVEPGSPVAFTVTFDNEGAEAVTLDTITDLLPAPFQYVHQAYGSDIEERPDDDTAPDIVWDDWDGAPPVVPAGGSLVLRYWVWVPPETRLNPGIYTNQVTAYSGSSPIGSDSADVTVEAPSFVLNKAASPTKLTVGENVVYTVTFDNEEGTSDGELTTITDTLPAGFEFVEMVAGSELTSGPPAGTTGTLVWTENFEVPAGETRQVIYRVKAGGIGSKENQVEALTTDGTLLGPESAAVEVEGIRAYLPLVIRQDQPVTTLPFEDTFNQGVSSDWVVFVNYPELSADSWLWTGDAPTWGRYVYDFEESTGGDNYALSMYLGAGSQAWTDYEVTTTMKNTREKIAGLWVRGTHEERTDLQGGQVGGYYVWMKPGTGRVLLARINPGFQQYHQYDVLADVPYTPGIGTVGWFNLRVRVQGTNIKVWLKKVGDSDYGTPLIDKNDGTYTHGTVGFSAWRSYVLYDDITVTPLTASDQ